MLELKYGKDGLELKCDKALSENDYSNIIKLLRVANEYQKKDSTLAEQKVKNYAQTQTPVGDLSSRERLPNNEKEDDTRVSTLVENNPIEAFDDDSEEPIDVDLSELDIANFKANVDDLFRCPSCGQSVVAIISGTKVVRDLEGNNSLFTVPIDKEFDDYSHESIKEYLKDHNLVYLAADENTHAKCPMCESAELIEMWIEAFNEPLRYFEHEDPCPMCGTETVTNILPLGGNIISCENKGCAYVLKEVKMN